MHHCQLPQHDLADNGRRDAIAKLGELLERLKVVLADRHIAGEGINTNAGWIAVSETQRLTRPARISPARPSH